MQQTLIDLINIRTIAQNNSKLFEIVDYVDMFFDDVNVITRRFESNKKPSIVISSKFTKSPKIILNGHLDVVDGLEEQFQAFEKDGKICGRGASDMKGQVVAMMYAFKEVIQENKDLDIALMLTTDEESGGGDGVNYLLNSEGFRSEIAFIPDGANGDWSICTNEKGIIWYDIKVKGKVAHASRKWEGDSANEKLIEIVYELKKAFLEKYGEATEDDQWNPSFNVGKISGGVTQNSVSEESVANLDIRFTEKQSIKEMKSFCDNFISKYENVTGEMPVYGEATNIDSDNSFLKNWISLYKDKFGEEPMLYKTNGGSDARFFAEHKIPILSVKPTASRIHINDEWIDVGELVKFKDLIKDWLVENS
jgi:succinyl-diaminopimelate desuccinylase